LLSGIKKLSLDAMRRMIEPLDIKKAVLGGGEPTADGQLVDVIRLLDNLNARTVLLTNGYALNENRIEKLKDAGLGEICVSIKAIRDALHIQYTGKSNERVLRNFQLLYRSGIQVRAESVLIPQLIGKDEIISIAIFIASVGSSIPYRVDGYVPVQGTGWRAPFREEMIETVEEAKNYLEDVSYIYSGIELKGNVLNVYPQLQDDPRTDLVNSQKPRRLDDCPENCLM